MEITAKMVQELREKTACGMMECKKALIENNGDMEKAMEFLRKKGLATAQAKADRTAKEGMVCSYVHPGSKIAVLVELNCETDFVARTAEFQEMSKDVAMHIAAMNPAYLKREEIPAEIIEKEKEVYRAQLAEQKKPANVIEKIIEGKLEKYYEENCLLDQIFVKDETKKKKVKDLVIEKVASIKENISIRRYVRYELGK
ncbi:MAG: translation elongation factor Ts [Candidatus Wallbacteria bacterium]